MKNVKCCFLIDATASMGPYIESAKRQARNIATTLKEENPDSNFLFGAVFYRDFSDSQQFIVVPFTDDITDRIRHIDARGGGDIPENVAGGYQKVLDMRWHFADVKFCFHIADAPPHGLDWHDEDIHDLYQNPPGRDLNDILRDLYQEGIRLSFVRINSTTDRMIENFKNIYGSELNVTDLMITIKTDTPIDVDSIELLDNEFSTIVTDHISSTLSMME